MLRKNKKAWKIITSLFIFFELKKIIYGCKSYWSFIKDPHSYEEITQEMINVQWYIELLKSFFPIPKE